MTPKFENTSYVNVLRKRKVIKRTF